MRGGRFSLALKDETVEQCLTLRSCGSELQRWAGQQSHFTVRSQNAVSQGGHLTCESHWHCLRVPARRRRYHTSDLSMRWSVDQQGFGNLTLGTFSSSRHSRVYLACFSISASNVYVCVCVRACVHACVCYSFVTRMADRDTFNALSTV